MWMHIKATLITVIDCRKSGVTTHITGVCLVAGKGFYVEGVLEVRKVGDLLTCGNAAWMEVKVASAAMKDSATTLLATEVADEKACGVRDALK